MERSEATAYLKRQMEHYLQGKGIDTARPFRCLNPAHEDRHPSMSFDPRRHKVHCFACGVDWDLLDLIAAEYHTPDAAAAFAQAYALYPEAAPGGQRSSQAAPRGRTFRAAPKTPPSPAPLQAAPPKADPPDPALDTYLEACRKRAYDTNYFALRGIGSRVVERMGLGYDPGFDRGTGGTRWQAVIIPTGPDSYTARNTDPKADKKHRIRKQGAGGLYLAEKALAGQEPVFVVEGEFDALSLIEVGASALALGSVANVRRLLTMLSQRARETVPPLLLLLDSDESGRRATQQLLEGLEALGLPAQALELPEPAGDPNELLIENPEGLRALVQAALRQERERAARERREYQQSSAAAHLPGFIGGIAASVDTEATRTGFPRLDEALDGGLYEGLYIVGAISSLGKTTLLCQMADQIAKNGQDVLIFSLEMARTELMAKSISRLTLAECLAQGLPTSVAKTARGITSGKRYPRYSPAENAVIRQALDQYAAYAEHLFISEGVGDIGAPQIREGVRRHIDITGGRPVVIVDYLQILAPASDRATDKQNTDRAVLELKRISRDYKIPVIGISSFNRANYAVPVTMEAFKESGAIEYSSDVLVGLQLRGAGESGFDVNEAKRRNPREVELVILKNRNGATGEKVPFSYYPMFNYFAETQD